MTGYLYRQNILIFDYAKKFANPLREAILDNAEVVAETNGLEIKFIRKSKASRKEARLKKILCKRGPHPGLIFSLSEIERCSAFILTSPMKNFYLDPE